VQKKIIYTTMIESNFEGWIAMDAKGTLKYWDNPNSNYGLAIDVYDSNENHLDAKEHFDLQDCEAGMCVVAANNFFYN
jgi:hypothetical protein